MVEMASRAATKLADNLDEKKVLSSDCTIIFPGLERDIDAYVKRTASHLWAQGDFLDKQPANARY